MSSTVSFRGKAATGLAFAVELWGLLPSSGDSVNLTSLSVRTLVGTLAGVGCSGCSGGGLRYLGTARSDSAHRSCACSSTWGLLDAHSSGHATAVAGEIPSVAGVSASRDDRKAASSMSCCLEMTLPHWRLCFRRGVYVLALAFAGRKLDDWALLLVCLLAGGASWLSV